MGHALMSRTSPRQGIHYKRADRDKAVKEALKQGEDFTVEQIEPGLYQSVFPTPLAHKSDTHIDPWDAWEYIAYVILGKDREMR